MARGYKVSEIKHKLIEILQDSKTGLSGVEISKKLGINRITVTKYLGIFATEGLIKQKNIGNVTLWSLEKGIEQYTFPDDYFVVESKFSDLLISMSENQVYSLIRNCISSGVSVPKFTTEVILPATFKIKKLYDDGKIGDSEEKLLRNIVSHSLQILNQQQTEPNPKKNIITIAADPQSSLLSEMASTSLQSQGWRVFHLGDMSSSINVIFDLDLQKLLGKIWRQKEGIMVVAVFSESEEGLNFFAEAVNSLKTKLGKKLRLVLCGKVGKKTKISSDLLTSKFDDVLQWSETVFESSEL